MRSGDTLIVEEDSAAKRQREEKQQEALLHAYEAQNQAGNRCITYHTSALLYHSNKF